MKINELDFNLTCSACPEQYDVTFKGIQVCYVRLRFGVLTARYPDVRGETIYSAEMGDDWQGCFSNQSEREKHLTAIANKLIEIGVTKEVMDGS